MSRRPRLTRRGWATLLAGVSTFVVARGLGTPALATLGLGLLIVVAAAYAATAVAAAGVTGARSVHPPRPRAGEAVEVRARVDGPHGRRRMVGLLEWRIALGADLLGEAVVTRASEGVRAVIDHARRGDHALDPMRLTIGDTFGIAYARRTADAGRTVTVPPRTVPSVATVAALTGRRRGRVALLGEDISSLESLREYAPGDPLSRVHWGQSAKRGKLHTKVFRPDDGGGRIGTVLLDCALESQPGGEAFELAVIAAASVTRSVDATRGGAAPVNLWFSDAPSSRPAMWAEAERRFASARRRDGVPTIARVLTGATRTLSPGHTLVVVTADPDPAVAEIVAVARRSGIDAALIRIADDDVAGDAVISVPDEAALTAALSPAGRGRAVAYA